MNIPSWVLDGRNGLSQIENAYRRFSKEGTVALRWRRLEHVSRKTRRFSRPHNRASEFNAKNIHLRPPIEGPAGCCEIQFGPWKGGASAPAYQCPQIKVEKCWGGLCDGAEAHPSEAPRAPNARLIHLHTKILWLSLLSFSHLGKRSCEEMAQASHRVTKVQRLEEKLHCLLCELCNFASSREVTSHLQRGWRKGQCNRVYFASAF